MRNRPDLARRTGSLAREVVRPLPAPDELEPRRRRSAAGGAEADRAAAATERRLAEADRRRAAEQLAAAYRDELTGALNRRPGRQQLEAAVARARAEGAALGIVFFDLDSLKRVNDVHGHQRGDQLLAATGEALQTALRSGDVIVRYGGDEFVCALPGATAEDVASTIERVHRTLDRLMPGATVTAGSASLQPADGLDDVIGRADADLYRQRRGRLTGDRAGAPHRGAVAADRAARSDDEGSITCGACTGRIPGSAFVLVSLDRMTRSADCPRCGETTLILLASQPRPVPR